MADWAHIFYHMIFIIIYLNIACSFLFCHVNFVRRPYDLYHSKFIGKLLGYKCKKNSLKGGIFNVLLPVYANSLRRLY